MKRMQITWTNLKASPKKKTHMSKIKKKYYLHVFWGEIACDYIQYLTWVSTPVTTYIFVNVLLYLIMWQHWRNNTLLQCKKRGVLTFVASGLDINGCLLSYFEGTANLHCYTSCTLTTLHCSKVSFLQCWHMKRYNTIYTKMLRVYSLLWDTVYIYIAVFEWNKRDMKVTPVWGPQIKLQNQVRIYLFNALLLYLHKLWFAIGRLNHGFNSTVSDTANLSECRIRSNLWL